MEQLEQSDIFLDQEANTSSDDEESWAVSYSDLMTLLLVFFIVLVSAADLDQQKLDKIQTVMKGEELQKDNTELVVEQILEALEQNGLTNSVTVTKKEDGIVMVIKDDLFFASGQATVSSSARDTLAPIINALTNLPSYSRFIIEGHTDDSPIHTASFPSNWYLSAARSIAVLGLFEGFGFSGERLSAQAYGSTRPMFKNRDKDGNPIEENQKRNRRVVIRVL